MERAREVGEAGVGPFRGGVGMCVFVRPEISARGARAEWCARVRADGRARAQSRKEINKEKQARGQGIRERCRAEVYLQARVVLMRCLCCHLSFKRLRKPQALNIRTRSRSNTFRLRAFPAIIPNCLSDIPSLQRNALRGFLAI